MENLEQFRKKVQEYRAFSGQTQQALAKALGLHPCVLSNKLNGTAKARLTLPEIKKLILTLVSWETIAKEAEVVELLDFLNLKRSVFSDDEWRTAPLNQLELMRVTKLPAPSKIKPFVSTVSASGKNLVVLVATFSEADTVSENFFHEFSFVLNQLSSHFVNAANPANVISVA